MKILVVNSGSSSHKLSLYDLKNKDPVDPLWKGGLDWQQSNPCLSIKTQDGRTLEESIVGLDVETGLHKLILSLWQGPTKVIENSSCIERVGHRVVHGGKVFLKPVLIDSEVKEEIKRLIPLAPLHNPADLEAIGCMEKFFPNIPQIAIFDTSFHSHIPNEAQTYAIPYSWKQEGIQKYGFHGISHQYCAERVAFLLNKDLDQLKIISCHLGNGSSLCAIRNGKSIDTTMGFTPLEGLMMGTRCGSIDPGILLYLLREKNLSYEEIDRLLNFESGLKGICGSSDMRDILEGIAQEEDQYKLAFTMYIYRLRSYLGAYLAQLKGADVICFTGGIGENVFRVREEACCGFNFVGLQLDENLNQKCTSDQNIASVLSRIQVFVIHTKEEWMIAKFCFEFS